MDFDTKGRGFESWSWDLFFFFPFLNWCSVLNQILFGGAFLLMQRKLILVWVDIMAASGGTLRGTNFLSLFSVTNFWDQMMMEP